MQVSVIIPVYNAEPYVRKAVESALQQRESAEVILIEDNSPDDSLRVCQGLEQEYEIVRLLRHPDGRNHGAGATRNLGIKSARFDYVAFLDADDFYLPGRFKVARQVFREYPDIDGVYEAIGVHFDDPGAKEIWFSRMGTDLTTMTEHVDPGSLFEALLKGVKGYFSLDGLVVKKTIFDKCGYFLEHLRLHQDTAMTIQMAHYGKLVAGRLDSPVAMRRVHSANRFLNEYNLRQTKYLQWKALFHWAYERELERTKLIVLFHRYMYSLYRLAKAPKQPFDQTLGHLKELVLGIFSHPCLFLPALREFASRRHSL